ncbi:MAG: hypothetical protein ACLQQ4_11735 [Bacteroidia bacterium]
MKTLILLLIPCYLFGQSGTKVHSYNKKNGTHVDSYNRTKPNKTKTDNYSSKGNTNPYTGKKGYKK